jgi:demethylmenaquinone methyltransferase/2-methoxy-6-polyprenyl-1,4-benzoquinol methylase
MREGLFAKRGSEVRAMFGRIAPRYDLLNRLLSLGRDSSWRRAVADRVADFEPSLILDLCTGTGDLALALDAPVIGADFCLPMLEVARKKAIRVRRKCPLCAADAMNLPFADASVDAVTVAFGIRNFETLDLGLRELARVVRPGGRVVILEFSRPRGTMAPLLGWWVRSVPPWVGRLISGDGEAYTYLPVTVGSFPDGAALAARIECAGFESVTVTPLTGGVASLYEGRRVNGRADESR